MRRTLVISDLHLGGRFFRGVLTRAEPLNRLLEALDGIDRLVLLGDTVELSERRPARAMALATPVLRELGRRLGPDREVVIVPGNHDFPLIRDWVAATGADLRLDHCPPLDASPSLAWMVAQLAPARVSVRYPGVRLQDRLFATHGHYLDIHLRPVSSFGMAPAQVRRAAPRDRAIPDEYERAGRRERARRLPSHTHDGRLNTSELIALARFTVARQVKARLLRPRASPLTAALLNAQMVRSGIPALAYACARLGVDADWVIFGHLHRLGPLAADAPRLWQPGGGGGRVHFMNTGSWLWEPLLVQRAEPPHPYWPGGAILLDGGEPRAIGLLDGLAPGSLRP